MTVMQAPGVGLSGLFILVLLLRSCCAFYILFKLEQRFTTTLNQACLKEDGLGWMEDGCVDIVNQN